MSVTLGDAILWLKSDDSKLNTGLSQAEGKVKGWVGSLGGSIQTGIGVAMGGAINWGIGQLVGSFGDLKKGMIDGNAEFEGYNTQFTVMLGSADAAKKRLADLSEFGRTTPYDLPEVVKADKILQGFGLHSEEAAKKFGFSGKDIRTIAGDVASGTGASFQEMALLIGKFSSGATGDAMARMAELGITNREEFSKMGLEFSKGGELLSPLPKSMEIVLQLMKQKYGGLMDAQSSTFTGMMSNLNDWWGQTLRTIGQPLFETLKDKLGILLEFLGSPAVQQAVQNFAQFLSTGLGVVIDWLNTTALPALQQFADWWTTTAWPAIQPFLAEVWAQLLPGLQQIGTWVMQLAQFVLPLLAAAWDWISQNMNIVLLILAAVGVVILALTSPIGLVIAAIMLLATAWANNWGGIQQITQAVWDFISPYINQGIAFISTTITTALAYIQDFWNKHGANIMTIVNTYIQFIWGIIQLVLGLIMVFWNNWGQTIITLTTLAWDNIKTIVKAAMDILGFIIDAAAALISGDWDAFGAALQGIWNTAWEAIKTILSNAGTALQTVLANLVKIIKETIWDPFVNGLKQKWDDTWKLIQNVGGGLQAAIQGIIDGVKAKWTEFADGLKTKWDTIWEGIKTTVTNALAPIKTNLDSIMSWVQGVIDGLLRMIGLGGAPALEYQNNRRSRSPSFGGDAPGGAGSVINNYFSLGLNSYASAGSLAGEYQAAQALLGT